MSHQTVHSALNMALLLFIFAVSVLTSPTAAQGTMCKKPTGQESSNCVCQTESGGIIDLNPISTRLTTTKPDNKGYVYEYSPCQPFGDTSDQKLPKKCQGYYICQTSASDASTVYAVAQTLDSNIYVDAKNHYYLHYTGPVTRDVMTYLNCDQSTKGKITSVRETSEGTTTSYVFQLNSCYACPGGCHKKSGVILVYVAIAILILLLVAIVIYLIIHGILMKVRYQARGTDVIPNKRIRLETPSLVKDGVLYTFVTPMKRLRSGKDDYQKIQVDRELYNYVL